MMPLEKRLIRIEISGKMLPLYVADNVAALVDDPADPDQTPCWAEAWPAARGLAAYFLQGPNPVSYTHLDVYKRQLQG